MHHVLPKTKNPAGLRQEQIAAHMTKQKELEAQRDAGVAAGDHHWVESYDPEQHE
jgi:hypothetical protein